MNIYDYDTCCTYVTNMLTNLSLFFFYFQSAVVNDKYANQLKRMLFIPQLAVEVIQIVLLSSGALILLITVLYGVYKQKESHKVKHKCTVFFRL